MDTHTEAQMAGMSKLSNTLDQLMLGENEQVMQRREKCSQRLELLQTAYRELTVSLSSR